MKKRLLCIWFIILTGAIFGAEFSKTIKINNQTITFDNPVKIKNETLFVPISSLKKELHYSISNNKKINGFNLKFKHFTIALSQHSREIWINNNPYFFKNPTFKFKNEIYIPLEEFLTYSGFKLSKTDSTLTIKKEKIPIYPKKDIKLVANKTAFPRLKQDTETKIIHNNFSFSIKNKFFYKNQTCFMNFESILTDLGYKTTTTEDEINIKYGEYTYIIPFNKRQWIMKRKNITQTFTSSESIKLKNGVVYFPFQSFITFLDYSIHQRWFKNEILLLSNINKIQTINKNEMLKINIQSRHKLNYNIIDNTINQNKSLEIPFSLIKLNKQNSKIEHSFLTSYNLSKGKDFSNKFKLNYEKNNLNLFVKNKKHGLTLQFNPSLELITELSNTNTDEIIIESNGDVTANIQIEKKSGKLIIDFNKTINNLPQIVKRENKTYKKIRTSQLSTEPLVTRVVVDFEDDFPEFRTAKINNKFRISIDHKKKSIEKEEKLITIKTTKNKEKKIAKKRTKKNILANKVVILDPGHGGTDPGAVVKNRFEKDYTLDVAKRLKKKLTQAGAYVIMTREKDVSTSLAKRAYIANANKGDIFISIHMNSFSKPYVNGTETYYYKYKDKSLALHVQRQLNKDIQLKNNGIKQSRLYVLRHSKSPSCLIEPLFLTNKKEHALVKTTTFREKLAGSIFQGIKNYFVDMK